MYVHPSVYAWWSRLLFASALCHLSTNPWPTSRTPPPVPPSPRLCFDGSQHGSALSTNVNPSVTLPLDMVPVLRWSASSWVLPDGFSSLGLSSQTSPVWGIAPRFSAPRPRKSHATPPEKKRQRLRSHRAFGALIARIVFS